MKTLGLTFDIERLIGEELLLRAHPSGIADNVIDFTLCLPLTREKKFPDELADAVIEYAISKGMRDDGDIRLGLYMEYRVIVAEHPNDSTLVIARSRSAVWDQTEALNPDSTIYLSDDAFPVVLTEQERDHLVAWAWLFLNHMQDEDGIWDKIEALGTISRGG